MNEALRIESLTGPAIRPYLDAVARLRIAVFRDFPYLYDGSLDYETDYLAAYSACAESLFVLVYAGSEIVGASTGMPLAAETAALRQPFQARGLAVESVFYFGESVLLRSYRGRGLGRRFFDAREGYARQLGRFTHTAFCAVERPMDHPLRPADHRPLDAFWAQRGYHRDRQLQARMRWKDVDQAVATDKTMVFWLRTLAA
ncbi:MAG TPA: GNAT family N-acetyltransferase [Gammaproteobacteria bacterium]|nr:GNAT family N-acetyltransferase [Gammaproteobacteria bacterium]